MSEQEINNEERRDNFKDAICYIPLVAIFLYFTEKNPDEEYKKHIKYWMLLFWLYIVITTILRWMLLWGLTFFVFLAYIILSLFLWFKAYNWDKVEVEILDNISDKLENK